MALIQISTVSCGKNVYKKERNRGPREGVRKGMISFQTSDLPFHPSKTEEADENLQWVLLPTHHSQFAVGRREGKSRGRKHPWKCREKACFWQQWAAVVKRLSYPSPSQRRAGSGYLELREAKELASQLNAALFLWKTFSRYQFCFSSSLPHPSLAI